MRGPGGCCNQRSMLRWILSSLGMTIAVTRTVDGLWSRMEGFRPGIGDGALGFWAALRKVFPETDEQRCWVHKTANVLNKMPKSVQPKAKADLHEIWQAETKANAERAFDEFLEKYNAKYQSACDCLRKDRAQLLSFYDFPAEHWAT